MATLALRAPYAPAFAARRRVHVGAPVSAPSEPLTTPLMAEPTIVTHGDLMAYIAAIDDLIRCLDKDARAHLVYQNPGKLRAAAKTKVATAADLDGCTDYYFNCPKADPKGYPPPSPADLAATKLRAEAALDFAAADAMEARATARGLKNDTAGNAAISAELAWYAELRALAEEGNRLYSELSATSVAGGSDWRKVQALDVRYQRLRSRYRAFGFIPSCALPDFTQSTVPWGWIAAGGVLVGIGLVLTAVFR